MSSIFERLARLARAEFNHAKAVISDRDDDAPEDVRARREEELRRAREELERAEANLRQVRREDGASGWGRSRPAGGEPDFDRGASAWAEASDDDARDDDPIVDADTGEPSGRRARERPERPASRRRAAERYPREIRQAYATLELPMGSDRRAVEAAAEALTSRFEDNRRSSDPRVQDAARGLEARVTAARERLVRWLDRDGG